MRWRRVLRWEPGRQGWRVAVLFMVGSSLFALGSFPLYAQTVDPRAVGVTFVVGSVFFTSAAVGQLLQARRPAASGDGDHRLLLWAAAVQLAASLEEGESDNYVRAHVQADLASGTEHRKATTRIFGSRPGTYGAGLLQLIDSRDWRTDADLAEVY